MHELAGCTAWGSAPAQAHMACGTASTSSILLSVQQQSTFHSPPGCHGSRPQQAPACHRCSRLPPPPAPAQRVDDLDSCHDGQLCAAVQLSLPSLFTSPPPPVPARRQRGRGLCLGRCVQQGTCLLQCTCSCMWPGGQRAAARRPRILPTWMSPIWSGKPGRVRPLLSSTYRKPCGRGGCNVWKGDLVELDKMSCPEQVLCE